MLPGKPTTTWALLILALALAACSFGGSGGPAEPVAPVVGLLPITAPTEARVGEPVTVTVGPVTAPDGTVVALTLLGTYGPHVLRAPLQGGVASFTLPPEATRRSGMVTLSARAGEARGDATLLLRPGEPVEPLALQVGATTVVVGGEETTMLIALPVDRHGNPAADGTPVTFRARRPDGAVEESTEGVAYLLAWRRLLSGTLAGRTTVAASSGEARGPEATVQEVPSWPARFTLTAEPPAGSANGQELITVRTSVITDRFGNVVPDGTMVTLVAQEPGGTEQRLPAYTVEGRAVAQLRAPQQGGVAVVSAVVGEVESGLLRITFAPSPAAGSFPVVVATGPDGTLQISAGPLTGPLGEYLADGSTVRFVTHDQAGGARELAGLTEAGRAIVRLRLADLAPGRYRVEVSAGGARGSAAFTVGGE